MLCTEFEDRLTDYLDGALEGDEQSAFAGHALRCPVCHDLLSEVRNTIVECRSDAPPQPTPGLEARILLKTAPETSMTCAEFEEHLTDYLDGFLPATLYHRWERHAALCETCSDLPGQVVRAIGACYTYISEERPLPAGLHARILQATLGTTEAEHVRAPLAARVAEWMRGWLDVLVNPQLATVATMALLAVLVGTSTLSPDGSISGMYDASLRLAARTYNYGASHADEFKRATAGFVSTPSSQEPNASNSQQNSGGAQQQPEQKNR
ncbi:MAG TPA: zf-HC2 domain-containing protein [Pyrinomonadaceae bacterium]|nr:zf-HC2 domain-containing protein [Pyrinomonadaceae bacterium]